jgi:D-glycero-alpha-D-manno-heptose-7-phosphate kinase
MFAIGAARDTRTVLSDQSRNVALDGARFEATARMVDLVWELRDALLEGRLERVGPLLHRNWELKRGLSTRISTGPVDAAYDAARAAGAAGGKLLGAGGGGYLLVVAEPERHAAVRRALAGLAELPVRFTAQGSAIAYTDGAPPWTSTTTSRATWLD